MEKDTWITEKEEGELGLLMVTKLFLLLTIILLCVEFYSCYRISTILDKSIRKSCQSAIELSMLDSYRREHISILDKDMARKRVFDEMIINLGLDDSLNPDKLSDLESRLDIHELYISSGSIDKRGKQLEYPRIIIRGDTKYRLRLLGLLVSKEVTIGFDVEVTNVRYD